MDSSLYSVMSAAKQYGQLHEINTNNVANANTNGFKADRVSFKALYLNGGDAISTSAFTELNNTTIDLTAGALAHTGNGSDMAVSGDGFFELVDSQGNNYYRRTLSIMRNNNGELVNADGGFIQGDTGGSIKIGDSPFKVDHTGSILLSVGEARQNIGKFKVVNIIESEAIKLPSGEISVNPEYTPLPATNYSVAQGYQESSNVNSVKAMATLITTQKNYEMSVKTMTTLKGIHSKSNTILE